MIDYIASWTIDVLYEKVYGFVDDRWWLRVRLLRWRWWRRVECSQQSCCRCHDDGRCCWCGS